ncbi:MAG: hypothetical protein RIB58_02545 [Phycisphaerales bacterium]|jgi:bacterioferritin-associated ferredoxin
MGQQDSKRLTLADLDRPTGRVRVERCVCFNQPFTELLRLSREEGLSHAELSDRTGCCTGCGMCKPYVRVVLSTGRTSIPLMNGRDLKAIAEEAEARTSDASLDEGSASGGEGGSATVGAPMRKADPGAGGRA